MKNLYTLFLTGLFFLLFNGCYSNFQIKTTKATLGEYTLNSKDLLNLPKPKEKIICAVYKFRDQTGQYKLLENGSSWSTAVTQGATSILTKALEESGWFVPIEREGLSNLLNERKIIRSSRENFLQNDSSNNKKNSDVDLPPLLFAGVLLEGGIISYETNTVTGGLGLKYFGTGASEQYRQDQVTIYLRAISTQNGRVLKTVYTTKTIISQLVDVGLFKYVDVNKILEAEGGYSYNEPPQLCVTAAIEKAVESLVIEGIMDKFWVLQNPNDMDNKVVKNYLHEKEEMQKTENISDNLQNKLTWGIGALLGGTTYTGDYGKSIINPSANLNLNLILNNEFNFYAEAGFATIETERTFKVNLYSAEMGLMYYFTPNYRMSPFIKLGGNVTYRARNLFTRKGNLWFRRENFASVNTGFGVRYIINDNLAFLLLVDDRIFFNDKIDNRSLGKYNDFVWGIKAGLTFYFD